VIGSDSAGTVVSIGSGISRFKIGDRVVGQARGILKNRNSSAEGAFQSYTVLSEDMTSQIPDDLSFESAAVLPLGLSTAVSGLFLQDQLGLQLPTAPAKAPTGKTALIWGGSTSVGSNAIQLAVAAGYEVITVRTLYLPLFSNPKLTPNRPLRRRISNTSKSWELLRFLIITAQLLSQILFAHLRVRRRRAHYRLVMELLRLVSISWINVTVKNSSLWRLILCPPRHRKSLSW
jgi:hypothetical protein